LREHFTNSDFLFDKPEVINEISFERKSLVENHLLFCGDSAGMIAPLCGNGMAMAIQSGKILAETINQFAFTVKREKLEREYVKGWERVLSTRLKAGRVIQSILQNRILSDTALSLLNQSSVATKFVIDLTHGTPF
jgi:flavin-dependent dehydrogenase